MVSKPVITLEAIITLRAFGDSAGISLRLPLPVYVITVLYRGNISTPAMQAINVM